MKIEIYPQDNIDAFENEVNQILKGLDIEAALTTDETTVSDFFIDESYLIDDDDLSATIREKQKAHLNNLFILLGRKVTTDEKLQDLARELYQINKELNEKSNPH